MMLAALALAAAIAAPPSASLIPASAPGYQYIGRFQHMGDTSMFDMPVSSQPTPSQQPAPRWLACSPQRRRCAEPAAACLPAQGTEIRASLVLTTSSKVTVKLSQKHHAHDIKGAGNTKNSGFQVRRPAWAPSPPASAPIYANPVHPRLTLICL